MKKNEFPLSLQRVVARYVRAFSPERIILYGSYGRGNNHEGSDLDLLVIANITDKFSRHYARAHQLAADCFPTVDVVFASQEEMEDAANAQNAFLISIIQYGISVYIREPPG